MVDEQRIGRLALAVQHVFVGAARGVGEHRSRTKRPLT
jgi:hypothetical protein